MGSLGRCNDFLSELFIIQFFTFDGLSYKVKMNLGFL